MAKAFTPGVLALYRGTEKKSSALHLTLFRATPNKAGYVKVEMTAGPRAFEYDWTQKIIFHLTIVELAALALLDTQEIKFTHKTDAANGEQTERSKRLKIKPAPKGGAWVDLSESHPPNPERTHSIAVNDEELFALQLLCREAIPLVIGWTSGLCQVPRDYSKTG